MVDQHIIAISHFTRYTTGTIHHGGNLIILADEIFRIVPAASTGVRTCTLIIAFYITVINLTVDNIFCALALISEQTADILITFNSIADDLTADCILVRSGSGTTVIQILVTLNRTPAQTIPIISEGSCRIFGYSNQAADIGRSDYLDAIG